MKQTLSKKLQMQVQHELPHPTETLGWTPENSVRPLLDTRMDMNEPRELPLDKNEEAIRHTAWESFSPPRVWDENWHDHFGEGESNRVQWVFEDDVLVE